MKAISPIHSKLLPSEIFIPIKGLTLKKIIDSWIVEKSGWRNATLEGFLNGEKWDISESDLFQLEKLDKSFRLTNVQLYEPIVKKICHDFYLETGKVLTANLYFTPHAEAQCFNWHSDNQYSLTYQLSGEKKWSFLRQDGVFLKETHEQEVVLKKFIANKLNVTEEYFLLKKGDWLQFPYCLLHKAQNEGSESSVHITFAYNHPTNLDMAKFLHGYLMNGDYSEYYFKPVDEAEYLKGLKKLTNSKENLQELFKIHYQEIELNKKEHGRPYG